MTQDLLNRITYNPNIMVGKPVIRGTRIPVDLLVRMVAQGISPQEILADYPRLQPEDLQAARFGMTRVSRFSLQRPTPHPHPSGLIHPR